MRNTRRDVVGPGLVGRRLPGEEQLGRPLAYMKGKGRVRDGRVQDIVREIHVLGAVGQVDGVGERGVRGDPGKGRRRKEERREKQTEVHGMSVAPFLALCWSIQASDVARH